MSIRHYLAVEAVDGGGMFAYIERLWERIVGDDTRTVVSLFVMAVIIGSLATGLRIKDSNPFIRAFGYIATVGLFFAILGLGAFWIGWYLHNLFTSAEGGLLGPEYPIQEFGQLWASENRLVTGLAATLTILSLPGIRGFLRKIIGIPAIFAGFVIFWKVLGIFFNS